MNYTSQQGRLSAHPTTMSRKPLVIIGLGETAEIAYEYFTHDSAYEVIGFSAEQAYLSREDMHGLPVVALERLETRFPKDDCDAFVAVSSNKLNRVRTRLFRAVKDLGYTCASYVSSRSFVWPNAKIGENCFIFEDNTIQPFVTIGDNVVLWSGNHIGHNSVINDNCFIASHVVVSGFCVIGENCFLGVNSTIINNVEVGRDCFIGAGALIQGKTEPGTVYQAESTNPSKVGSLRLFRIKE
jgi:sugar O-acyltransferase (sialic acid O-acetyltransferase NeuD family)